MVDVNRAILARLSSLFGSKRMWTKQRRKTRRGRLIVPLLAVLFFAYFGFHAYHGEYGLYSTIKLQERTHLLEAQLAAVRQTRAELEQQVKLMHDGTIEKDMLDEQARRALNLSRSDEVTIMRGSGDLAIN
jgi:cell division protein FtsB